MNACRMKCFGLMMPATKVHVQAHGMHVFVCICVCIMQAPWVDLGTGSGAIAIGVADVLRTADEVRQAVLQYPTNRYLFTTLTAYRFYL